MKKSKKLSLVALLSLMSSVALPTGRGGAASTPPMAHNTLPRASDIYGAGPSTFDSLGLSQPAYLDASDTYQEGSKAFALEAGPVIVPSSATAAPRLGQGGHGILKPSSAEYNKAKKALDSIRSYRDLADQRAKKGMNSTLTPGYGKYKDAVNTVIKYANPNLSTSNEIIA